MAVDKLRVSRCDSEVDFPSPRALLLVALGVSFDRDAVGGDRADTEADDESSVCVVVAVWERVTLATADTEGTEVNELDALDVIDGIEVVNERVSWRFRLFVAVQD